MKPEKTLFVDEATRRTMESINEGIRDSLEDFLQSSDALKTIEKMIGEIPGRFDRMQKASDSISKEVEKQIREISNKFDKTQKVLDGITKEIENLKIMPENMQSTIKDLQKKSQQELAKKLSDAQSLQTEELNSLVIKVKDSLSEFGKSTANNNKAAIGQIQSLESAIKDSQEKTRQDLDSLKNTIKDELLELGKSAANNHKTAIGQIQSLDARVEANSRRFDEIEKLIYLSLPFYKKMGKKPDGDKNPPENKRGE